MIMVLSFFYFRFMSIVFSWSPVVCPLCTERHIPDGVPILVTDGFIDLPLAVPVIMALIGYVGRYIMESGFPVLVGNGFYGNVWL